MFENAFLRLTGAILAIRVIKNSTVNFYSSCTLVPPRNSFSPFLFFYPALFFFPLFPPFFFFFKLVSEFSLSGEQQRCTIYSDPFSMKLYRDLEESFTSAGWKFLWSPNLT